MIFIILSVLIIVAQIYYRDKVYLMELQPFFQNTVNVLGANTQDVLLRRWRKQAEYFRYHNKDIPKIFMVLWLVLILIFFGLTFFVKLLATDFPTKIFVVGILYFVSEIVYAAFCYWKFNQEYMNDYWNQYLAEHPQNELFVVAAGAYSTQIKSLFVLVAIPIVAIIAFYIGVVPFIYE